METIKEENLMLQNVLSQKGIVEKLTSVKEKRRYQRLVDTLIKETGRSATILFKKTNKGKTYTATSDGENLLILVDLMSFLQELDSKQTLSMAEISVVLHALIYHEVGHVLWTDFQVIGRNKQRADIMQQQISVWASKINDLSDKEFDDFMKKKYIKETKAIDIQLFEIIKEYIYYVNLMDMLNSLEDGAIESEMYAFDNKSYGSLIFLRELTVQKELQNVKEYFNGFYSGMQSEYLIENVMTEMRAICTFGYRKDVRKKLCLIPHLYNKEDVERICELAVYARLTTQNTEQRNNYSLLLMDMLMPIIEAKAEEIKSALYQGLSQQRHMSDAELEQLIANQSIMSSQDVETLINVATNAKIPGNPIEMTGRYEINLPNGLKKQLQQKDKEGSSQEKSQSDEGNQKETQSSDSFGDKDNASSKNDSSQEKSQTNSGEKNNPPSNSNEENNNIKSKKTNTKKIKEQIDEVLENAQEDKSTLTIDEKQRQSQMQELQNQEEKNSNMAKNEALRNAQKTTLKQEEQQLIKQIKEGTDRDLNEIGINLIDKSEKRNSERDNGMSNDGAQAYQQVIMLGRAINFLYQKMKKEIMHRERNHSVKGRYEGKLNMNGLYRAKTDNRVFQRSREGSKKNVRFCILVDNSGSMSGDRLSKAITGCYMIAKCAQRLKIPYEVYGHESSALVNVTKYISYHTCQNLKSLDTLFKMEAGGGTDDDTALIVPLQNLARNKKNSEECVMIVLSDGDTFHHENIIDTLETYKKLYNIQAIGIGIGRDAQNVKQIYENHILVNNPAELPEKMIQMFKKLVI